MKTPEMQRLETDMSNSAELRERFQAALERIIAEGKAASDGEVMAQAAAESDAETPDAIVAELEENRGARLKNYLLRDPEKLFLVGKLLTFSACNRAIGQRMIDTAVECAPELAEFKELSWKEAAQRYTKLSR